MRRVRYCATRDTSQCVCQHQLNADHKYNELQVGIHKFSLCSGLATTLLLLEFVNKSHLHYAETKTKSIILFVMRKV